MTDRVVPVGPVVLHVSPHPDDEVLGCGATLCALRDAGWTVVNLACSLGRPEDRGRRAAELSESLAILRFVGRVAGPPVVLSDAAAAGDPAAGLVRAVDFVAAHAGEVRRGGYDDLIAARSRSAAILGAERVFGFGAPAGRQPYADLLTEAFLVEGVWRLGHPRRLDPSDPVGVAGDEGIDWWVEEPSVGGRRRRLRVAGERRRPYRSRS